MSDIPDWLVELAAQRDEDEVEDEDEGSPEWDFLRSEPEVPFDEADEAPTPVAVTAPAAVSLDRAEAMPEDAADLDESALIHTLRSQVEVEEEEAARVPPPSESRHFRIPGLLPWQQFVLALLLLLDVIVIGLLFLVMFGRMSFG